MRLLLRLLSLALLLEFVQAGGLWYRVGNVSLLVGDWLHMNQINNCFFQGDLQLMCLQDNELFKVIFEKIYLM
jgi:hypothetical protein